MAPARARVATIPGAVERAAADHGRALALVDDVTALTFAELLDVVRPAAGAFVEAGVGPGDRVALWAPNSVAWAVASLAVLFAGGSVVPVNTRYTPAEAADLVVRARCRLVVAGPSGPRDLAVEATAFDGAPPVVRLGGPAASDPPGWEAFVASAGSSAASAVDQRLASLGPDDVSHVQYTSGTTGRPKGAMLCHGAMVGTTAAWAEIVGLAAGDRYPVVAPFSHIGGHKTGLLACLIAGALALPLPALDLDRFEQVAAEHRVTVVQGPPTLFHGLVERARAGSQALGSLRVGVTGAAVVPPSLVRDMGAVLGLDVVVTAYGLTESTGVCTMTRPGDPVEVVAGTSGRPIPGWRSGSSAGTAARRRPGTGGRSWWPVPGSCGATSTIPRPRWRPCGTAGWLRATWGGSARTATSGSSTG